MSPNSVLRVVRVVGIAAAIAISGGCGGGGDESPAASAPQTGSESTPGTNAPPTIQGQPGGTVLAGQAYSFQPTANDSNGDTLVFSATNLPAWASLNASTGRLTGTPTAGDVGTYAGISISVSDGTANASLPPFSITVSAVGTGSATLSWTAPTQNTDGSVLTDLASYRILYGRSANALDQEISLQNASLSTYVVENLTSGAWYFTVIAVNSDGVNSEFSNVASKTIS